ncbi:23S rRNA (adenine(1618)-N(6))-methyltransferase RlmF [Cognatilysobacter tabacisoli]|uniref:23S rRNA (adenine(1618)-N(6))-methyltransferase RlmF n=1 Tax=Cognatilysobacter tabacisoli TaxID=2315424 RepID=UPI000E6AE7C2|nr:23S rRNA (adenine(1618)-N(6))-methyltransferase RlmF [Lysobacter tabacisoli]
MPPPPKAPAPRAPAARPAAPTLHPRNRHTGRYDFARLTAALPALARFVRPAPDGDATIDFGDPDAVRALNRALLAADYGIAHWDLPPGYLCPPVPGRADYVHALADLLAASNGGVAPRGAAVRVLDVGVGANAIYPLVGHREYGWRFVGTDIDAAALRVADAIVRANGLAAAIELRHQPRRDAVFAGVLHADERFDLTLCNPPFHASARAAAEGTERKWRNLGRDASTRAPALNFGGQSNELWCPGGEAAFVGRMIDESASRGAQVRWFTSLVSKAQSLPPLRRRLQAVGAIEVHEVAMGQGNKRSRFLAWSFLDAAQRAAWRALRDR